MFKKILIGFLLGLFIVPSVGGAQTLNTEYQGSAKAEVVEVIKTIERLVPGTQVKTSSQTIKARFLEGTEAGKEVELENDFLELKVGDKFFIDYIVRDGQGIYTAGDPDRSGAIWFLVGLFALTILIFGRFQGLRSLLALVVSFALIIFVLLPALLAGYPPVLVSALVAFLILTAAIFLTHGVNREASVALLGTTAAVIITGVLASIVVSAAHLSGFSSDEAVYLNIGTQGTLNFQGLLLGAIIIGTLGVLDDIAITQASAVRELREAAPNLTKKDLYKRAIAIGQEHVGALVNTLALAYAGASLPLLMLFKTSTLGTMLLLNKEVFAVEIARTVLGSIGLVLAVPITTALAVWLPGKYLGVFGRSGNHNHHH